MRIDYSVKTLDGGVVAAGSVEKGVVYVSEIAPRLRVGAYGGASWGEEGFASHSKTAFNVDSKFIRRRVEIRKSLFLHETGFFIRALVGKGGKQEKLKVTISHD